MFLKLDRLQAELPQPKKPDPNAAAALQELLGGKYGEMSTLGNYMFQSFNFRNKSKLRPFYSLVSSIFAEELGHIELVSTGIAMLNNGPGDDTEEVDVSKAPFHDMQDIRLAGSFLSNGGGATPINSNAQSWNVDMVTTTGNIIVDLLHNFHLECGARLHKLRVYETLKDPTGREVCGYLLVRARSTPTRSRSRSSPASRSRRCCPPRTSSSTRFRSARNTCRRVRTGGSTGSARTTIGRQRASGRTTRWRCRVIPRAIWRWSTAYPKRRRQDPGPGRQLRCLHAELRAGRGLRDRQQALQEEPLSPRGFGAGRMRPASRTQDDG